VSRDQAAALEVRDRWDGGTVTVTVTGEIDVSTAGVFSARLAEAAGRHPERLVIDMAGVGFLDSAGLSCLVRVRRLLPEHCPVIVRSAQRRVRQVFDLTGLSTVYEFE
jgi:anti-anti-sigma factor